MAVLHQFLVRVIAAREGLGITRILFVHWPQLPNSLSDYACDTDKGIYQRLIHLQLPLIFCKIALVVRLIEYPPLHSFQVERVG